jgi:transketolase
MSPEASALTLEERCVDTVRFLAVDGVEKAKSGHPGMPMGAAPVAHTLFTRHLRFDPADPAWPDRDRFVLSAGHASMLLYALLHLTGYDLTRDDLREFRQWGSKTPGHPEYGHTPGVETTTGPLGQGLANAVGMAMAERFLAATFNGDGPAVVDHFTYALAGDGCMMEGITSEAASLAGHQKLGKLIVLYDDNHVTIDGPTDLAFTEDVCARYAAYGWHVQKVADGNDLDAVDAALAAARAETGQPSLVAVRTHIGCGSPNKQDKAAAHGAPLGADEVKLTKEACEWPLEPTFFVADDVKAFYEDAGRRGAAAHAAWRERHAAWSAADPTRAAAWTAAWTRELPAGWDADLPTFAAGDDPIATRSVSGKVINALAPHLPTLIGGSADLAPSNNTLIKDVADQQAVTPAGRNLHFGVRELAMAAIGNGMAAHGGIRPYVATFFVFVDYMRPAMRLSALMGLPVTYILTHDSVGVGEDGPTHQPIEHLAMLRATPNFIDLRPADANETVEAWRIAVEEGSAPVGLMLTRQNLPVIDRATYGAASGVRRGAYVLADAGVGAPDVILLASGSEVHLVLAAYERLVAAGVRARVVNMASFRLFERQDAAYREAVLPAACRCRLAVEAAASFGWDRWVGDGGEIIAIDRFGASAPAGTIFAKLGLTADNVYERAKALVGAAAAPVA